MTSSQDDWTLALCGLLCCCLLPLPDLGTGDTCHPLDRLGIYPDADPILLWSVSSLSPIACGVCGQALECLQSLQCTAELQCAGSRCSALARSGSGSKADQSVHRDNEEYLATEPLVFKWPAHPTARWSIHLFALSLIYTQPKLRTLSPGTYFGWLA